MKLFAVEETDDDSRVSGTEAWGQCWQLVKGEESPDESLAEFAGFAVDEKDAARLAACWNACHGLDIPEGVPPGALAALVDAALAVWDVPSGGGFDPSDKIGDFHAALAPFQKRVD